MEKVDFSIGGVSTLDTTKHSSTNTLYKHSMMSPVQLSSALTYLYGNEADHLAPLLMLTEGNGSIARLEKQTMNDTTFYWDVVGRMVHTFKVLGLVNTNNTKPGLGGTRVSFYIETDVPHNYWTIWSADKNHQFRVEGEPVKKGTKKYLVDATYITSSNTAYADPSQFVAGLYWVAGAPTAPAERSTGTTSNRLIPGKLKNQWGIHRFSMPIAGNQANKVTNINFPTRGGGTTKYWIPWEFDQFERDRREAKEHWLWYSEYNRNQYGEVTTIDEKTGEPVPYTAGLKQQIMATGNYSTYNKLTISKLNQTVHSVFSNRVDKTPMEMVLLTGTAGAMEFDRAIKDDARKYNYYEKLGQSEIREGGKYMSYGHYFNQYKTYEGHTLTVMPVPFFDQGRFAELDRMNGNLVGAFPEDSMNMVFLDVSATSAGERNITLTCEKGRETKTKIYAGMSDLPEAWGAMGDNKFIATKEDEASYEVMDTAGLAIKNATTSFWLNYQR